MNDIITALVVLCYIGAGITLIVLLSATLLNASDDTLFKILLIEAGFDISAALFTMFGVLANVI